MLALLLLACKDTPPPLEACATPVCVTLDADARTLTLAREGDVLATFPADGLALGTERARDDARSYDPLYPDSSTRWRALVSLEPQADGTHRALWEGGSTGTLAVSVIDGTRFLLELTPDAGGEEAVVAYRVGAKVDADEAYYGLGEWFDTPQHRGKVRPMQIAYDASLESAYNEAHVPVPLLVGTRGWALFVEDRHPMVFDVAATDEDRVVVTVGTGMDSDAGLRVHLYVGERALDLTKHYYATTGNPKLPARWALGPWLWRDEVEGQAQVEEDLATIRALDLATSGYWIDRPYASGVNSFDFDPARYDDARAMIARANDLGMRVALWHTPYVGEDEAPALHAEATTSGYFPPEIPIVFNSWGDPIDFSNPEADAWWRGLLERYRALGIEGYKLDYGEDVIVGIEGARLRWSFADGTDERTMHKRYADLYHRPYADQLPADGGFLLVRAGTWGDQVNGSIVWPGDLDADMSAFGDPRPDEDTRGVGGLQSAVSAAMGLGPSGYPFFASDTGGYRHSPPDKESFVRWVEHSALTTVMQTGNSASCMPWEFDEDNGWDAESLALYRDYARLHLRLWPYLWAYAERLATDGRAIVRPLGLVYPELGHPDDTYLLGDDLLVAPVVEKGATTRTHLVPEGRWVDWFTGELVTGPGEVTVDAPLGKLPLYLREGGVVPLLREDADTLATTNDATVQSVADDPGALTFRVVAGAASAFRLHDGSELAQEARGGVLTLRWLRGREFVEDAWVEVLGRSGPPSAVRDAEGNLAEGTDWTWDGDVLKVRVAGEVRVDG